MNNKRGNSILKKILFPCYLIDMATIAQIIAVLKR